jgi:hypothetical protein
MSFFLVQYCTAAKGGIKDFAVAGKSIAAVFGNRGRNDSRFAVRRQGLFQGWRDFLFGTGATEKKQKLTTD